MHIKKVDQDEPNNLSDSDYDRNSEVEEIQKELEYLQNQLDLAIAENDRIERENARFERQYYKCIEMITKTYESGVLDFKLLEEFCVGNENPDEIEQPDMPNSDDNMESNQPKRLSIGSEYAVRVCVTVTLFLHLLLPNGATLGTIHAHLAEKGANVNMEDLETLMRHYSTLFKEEAVNEDGALNKKWFFGLQIPPVPDFF